MCCFSESFSRSMTASLQLLLNQMVLTVRLPGLLFGIVQEATEMSFTETLDRIIVSIDIFYGQFFGTGFCVSSPICSIKFPG